MSDEIVLEARDINKSFGAIAVAQHVNLKLKRGARHALIGPNGAGKTTLVNLLTGVLRPSSGEVRLLGEDVSGLSQAARVKRGLARTFQINSLIGALSVFDNIALAVSERLGLTANMVKPRERHAVVREETLALLEELELSDVAERRVGQLPYGRQRLIELAAALALKPQVLLLDEPAAGVPSVDAHVLHHELERLPQSLAVLMIEHDMDIVFRFAQRITVLVRGEVLIEDAPAAVAADRRVREIYLGKGFE